MLEKYESGFEKEEFEITVLTKERCGGAGVWEKEWLNPSLSFIARIDNATGEVINEEGRLEWLIKRDPNRRGWGFDFEQFGIYRLLVRKSIPINLTPDRCSWMNNRYMVVKILEENVQNEKLLELKEYLSKPIVIDTPYLQCELDRSMSWFEGEIELGGFVITAFLETDEENGETADDALQVFLKTAENFEEFDKKNKEFAADNLLENAIEWQESAEGEHEELTKEKFMELMEISEMTFSPSGDITLYYNDGDMFWGHSIEITIEDGTYSDANIAG